MHVSVISSRLKFETSARKNMVGQGGGRLQVFDIDKNFMERNCGPYLEPVYNNNI
jgi:hypothetical protein